jgi:nucleoside phosphorylase
VNLFNDIDAVIARLGALDRSDRAGLNACRLEAAALVRRTRHVNYLAELGPASSIALAHESWEAEVERIAAPLRQLRSELQRDADADPPAQLGVALPGQAALVDRCDIVVVCALHRPELEKLRSVGAGWRPLPADPDDPQSYEQGTFVTKAGTSLRVVAAAPNQMGLSASAVLATKMILRFRPRLVAMVGIAAGVKQHEQGYGDILAAEHTFDYGAGKQSDGTGPLAFLPDPKPIELGPRILGRLKDWAARRTGLDDIYGRWPATKPSTVLKLHVGPLASGAAVLGSRGPVEQVLTHWRKVVGVEMEAYGVHRAARDASHPAPDFLCLKSICDFAEGKNDHWQDYAAYTAAGLFHQFVAAEWETIFPGVRPDSAR